MHCKEQVLSFSIRTLGRSQLEGYSGQAVPLSVLWQVTGASDLGSPNRRLILGASDLNGMKLKFRELYIIDDGDFVSKCARMVV